MRFLLIIFFFGVFAYAQERFCIEAISVDKKTDIGKDFIRKLSEISWPYKYKEIEGKHKVFVGDFTTRQEAEQVLPKIQEKLNQDAFVTVVDFEDEIAPLSSQSKMQQAALMAKAKMIAKPEVKKEEIAPVEKQEVALIDIVGPQDKQAIKMETKKVKKQKVKAIKNLVCKPTKKALRETEIADALEFYKNSSFYTFNAN